MQFEVCTWSSGRKVVMFGSGGSSSTSSLKATVAQVTTMMMITATNTAMSSWSQALKASPF